MPSSTETIGDGTNVPTRLHRANVLEDVFGRRQADPCCSEPLQRKPDRVSSSICAMVRPVCRPRPSARRPLPSSERERNVQWREVGLGAQILRDLRNLVDPLPALATRSRTYVGLAGFGIKITETEPLEGD